MKREIRVFSPATVANVACGFDIFGFALEQPGDEVVVRLSSSPGITLSKITGDGGALPLDPLKNTVGVSISSFLKHIHSQQGIEIELHKKIPLSGGLGSSAASAAGGVFGVNVLLGSHFPSRDLIPFAMEAEKIACGSAHADNVAPALLGGFVLVRSYNPLDIVQIPLAINLYCAIIHPHIEIRTETARAILKKDVTLQQHVQQSGNAAGLIAGLIQGDVSLIRRCLQDVIIEPIRSTMIPGFDDIKSAAIQSGALGCSISGSGPSVFAFALDQVQADQVGKAMLNVCKNMGLETDLYISLINPRGPTLL